MRLTDASRAAAASGWAGRLNTGGAGAVRLWSGTPPAEVGGASIDGVLQATIALELPAGDVVGTTYRLTVPRSGLRVAAGAITWAEVVAGDGAVLLDGTVSAVPLAADFLIDQQVGAAGALVHLLAPAEMRF